MRKRHAFRPPAPDLLEDRVVLHGGIDPVAAAAVGPVSTAADVFQPQMGRVLTAAYVFGNHLSRNDALQIIANQTRNAFAAFRTGLNQAVDNLETSGNRDAFDADVAALCDGLATRYAEILSTSPRAQNSLVPFGRDKIDGSGPDSLLSKLTALPIDTSNASGLDASRSLEVGVMNQSLRGILSALGTFARRPNFPFTSTNSGGGTPTPTPTPTPPAPPAALNSAPFSPTRIDLAWTKVDAATGYTVERSSNGTDYTRVATTNAATTTFSDTGLTPGTTYSYRILASNANGDSSPSPGTTATTALLNPPLAPAGFVTSPIQNPHGIPLAMHIHPHVSIIINGQQQTIPANIGITPDSGAGGFSATPIHVHDTSGNLHVESTQVYTFTLGDFFAVWKSWAVANNLPGAQDIVFNSQNILGHQVDSTHQLTVTVNGQPSTLFENQPLNDTDGSLFSNEGDPSTRQIVIDYEPIP